MNDLKTFKFWCQKVLPLVYDDSISYYEVLSKVVDYMNKIIKDQTEIIDMIAPYGKDFSELKKDVELVKSELEKVKNGDYVSLYIDSLSKWINDNLQEMVGRIVKFVAFGLTDDGYFYADIPDTWKFLTFDTDVIPDSETYGCLIMQW